MRFLVYILTFFLLSQSKFVKGQNDTLPFKVFKHHFVMYADLGFHSAPFSLTDNYGLGVTKLKYRNNIKAVLGIGLAFKGVGLRVGFSLPGNILAKSKYGDTEYFDAGLKFNIKQVYCAIDLRSYAGYAIKDAYKWNDSLTSDTPNLIQPNTRSASFSLNAWWFKSKRFKMHAFLGKVGHFTGPSRTWYFKTTLNFFGVADDFRSIVPAQLTDTSDRINANTIGTIDIGFIPGYALATRKNNWQISAFGGLGGVIQSKFYSKGETTRGFLGLAPRLDFKLVGGYSKPKFFLLLETDFDMKSSSIQDLTYFQNFYNVKLITGFRIPTKKAKQMDSQI